MSEFQKNTIATDEDYFRLSSKVYKDNYLHKGEEIEGIDGKVWKVIESVDADCQRVKNGLQAIAVVPEKEYKEQEKFEENKREYKTIIFAFRGTEFGKGDGDIETDVNQITFGLKKNTELNIAKQEVESNIPTSFDSSLEFVDMVNGKYHPTYVHATGHSKGAAEAHYVAAERNFYATTYAAPNIYRLLSSKAKKRVDSGEMDNKIVDYTHIKDAVGNFLQFGATLVGRQYTVKSNGKTDNLLALFLMGEHPTETFKGMFHANGSARLQLEPDEIIKEAEGLQTISHTLLRIAKNIEEFQRKEEEAIAELKRQLKRETGSGGRYHLLSEHDVDEAIAEIAKVRRNGQEYFYDVDLAEELIHLLQKEQKNLDNFGERIAHAAKSFRAKDGQLAEENFNWLGSR
ncbi:hypothetical protein ACIGHG_23420 [Bacillus sp. NPDC077411]|uniref:hypothetical protein n=1 Tax=Bacillus sp. NPDC077411 TaxID=3363947 RepID=UPI0037C83F0D